MQDDGELALSPAAAEAEVVEEETLPHVQPAQQMAVPETADEGEEGQAAVTPDLNPESPVGQLGSPSSPVGAPPAPTPTPNVSPRGRNAADIPGANFSAAARPGSASGTASRTICLRTLRGSKSSSALSSLAGWGGTVDAAATAGGGVGQGGGGRGSPPPPPPEVTAVAAPGQTGTAAVAVGVGGGLGVLPSANKVVDLREVKKVKPGPLASAAAAAAAPVPADDSDELEEGGGPVKIDISAGKRMIEFQLKQNATEEKREAARLKSERDRAGVCRVSRAKVRGWGGRGMRAFSRFFGVSRVLTSSAT